MPRALLAGLAIAAMSGLSCGIFSMAPRELPPVSAPARDRIAADRKTPAEAEIAGLRALLETRHTGLARSEVEQLAHTIVAEAQRNDLDPVLVMALIQVESRFDSFAASPVGALGLMQVLPSTGEEIAAELGIPWHGPQTLFDPLANVRIGTAYLRQLSQRYEHLPTALAAYNWGPGRIDRRLRRGTSLPKDYPRLVLEAHAVAQGEDRSS
jgi:soluble lytic murein transglycosylase